MARTLPAGQKMWVAYPGSHEQITIIERGTGGHVFKDEKPSRPYLIEDSDGDRWVISYDDLYDSPRDAAIEAARLSVAAGEPEPDDDESPDSDPDPDDDDDPDDPDDEDDEPEA